MRKSGRCKSWYSISSICKIIFGHVFIIIYYSPIQFPKDRVFRLVSVWAVTGVIKNSTCVCFHRKFSNLLQLMFVRMQPFTNICTCLS
jgi:hypothetical protein